ncbi:MAG TPA: hypothetical protein VG457_06080 [Planctomycetota bacterium]|jgi:hypothetical protein|nr:hypothetical protein [Planctomycetota bacterium]
MKLSRIIEAAGAAYPEILTAWDRAAEKPSELPAGDPVAGFVVSHIHRTYDPGASDKAQLKAAAETIRRTTMVMERTCWSLCEAWVEAAVRARMIHEDRR